ncbi:MAG: hypothetical protein H6Q05_635 [Acidobacteria bacterium]|nr:hypothetical protein [Acidobacteriota bacterium]
MQTKEEPNLVEELSRMEWEPLVAAEKKLIGYSIALGVVLLAVLYWVSTAFFSVQP